MRSEDLLAACLDARAQGQSANHLLADARAEQRAELQKLLNLVEHLECLVSSPPPVVREAIWERASAAAVPTRLNLVH